jgi:hypothetical protein
MTIPINLSVIYYRNVHGVAMKFPELFYLAT